MAEPKTKPTDASVDAFLDAATPARRRADGLVLVDLFREVTGVDPVMWGPSMVGFGRYRYISPVNPRTRGDWPKTAFSPRKASLSLYGLKDLPEGAALLPELGVYTEGMGCACTSRNSTTSTSASSGVSSPSPGREPTTPNRPDIPSAERDRWSDQRRGRSNSATTAV
ncbi:hypothetical protein nbrc107696_02080 [Gordonia spumicola]|uniref:YdhG-like domain-containing protein n=1 Tax=Gordonia spumicola TaxID=589161 RepID=A0A7I9V3M1_9ACTN|nr:DUF1801 domain-containing protein [Gordonia spumicola]GED99761.1 hypothetical protein nbrc107696_02080 [Gordonia spumicola]